MATETVKDYQDYLGHPSKLAEAFETFSEAVSDAREKGAKDIRILPRHIGERLAELNDRLSTLDDALEMVGDNLRGTGNEEVYGAAAAMKLAHEYARQTCNDYFAFAGMVLAALEKADMTKANMVQVHHD